MERANTIDAGEGPGPVFAKLAERFHPEAFYGNATKRQVFMVVNLDTPVQIAELIAVSAPVMVELAWNPPAATVERPSPP